MYESLLIKKCRIVSLKSIKALNIKLLNFQLKIEECNELKAKLEAQFEEEQKKYDIALEGLRAETQEFQDKKEKLETELIGLQKDENEKEAKYNVAKQELDLMRSTEQKEQCKMEQFKQKALTSKNSLKEKEAKLTEHSEKIPELEETLTTSAAEIQVLNEEYDACSKKVHGMRANVEETRSKQSAIKQVCNKHKYV